MSIEKNVQVVKDFFAVIGSGDKQRVLALVAASWRITALRMRFSPGWYKKRRIQEA